MREDAEGGRARSSEGADYRQPDEAADPADPVEGEAEHRGAAVEAAWHGQRLDKVLVALAPEFSRGHLQSLIDRGCVRVDGRVADAASRRVTAGQRVEVELQPTAQSLAFRPEPVPLAVVYEDAHLLVIDKPAGLVVHPAAGNWSGTLLNGLLARDPAAASLPRAGIVHRLDKDTSGLMVVGRTLAACTALVRAIAGRHVRREYAALCHGTWPADVLSVDAPIGRDPVARVRMAVVPHGRESRTDVTRVAVRDGISAVRCRLHTGRTHQIRVHLASRGHPLVGDTLYGGRAALGLQRQALHAERLAFEHPVLGGLLAFEAPMPPDLAQAWAAVTE